MSVIDYAYAAGILDGEGHLGIEKYQRRNGSVSHQLRVAVKMTDRSVPEWLQKMFAGSVAYAEDGRNNRRPTWRWTVKAQDAEVFLRAVQPFVRTKHRQVALALQFRELRGVVGRTPSMEVVEARERIRQEISGLNL